MNEDKNKIIASHNLILEDRTHLTLTGVQDVDSFDEQLVVVYTTMGELAVKGIDLHINKIDVESGELTLEGEVSSLTYSDQRPVSGGFWNKIFR